MDSITIWLVDDEKDISVSLSNGLQRYPHVKRLRWFQDCTSALKELKVSVPHPDIILLDINLPDIKGVKAIPMFLDIAPKSKILMLTGDDRSMSVVQSARSGVSGYLLKPLDVAEIVRACEEALSGNIYLAPSVVPHIIHQLPADTKKIDEYRLTPVESQLIPYLVDGLSDAEIAKQVGSSFFTVRAHLRNIHRKMKTSSRTELVSKIVREQLLP